MNMFDGLFSERTDFGIVALCLCVNDYSFAGQIVIWKSARLSGKSFKLPQRHQQPSFQPSAALAERELEPRFFSTS